MLTMDEVIEKAKEFFGIFFEKDASASDELPYIVMSERRNELGELLEKSIISIMAIDPNTMSSSEEKDRLVEVIQKRTKKFDAEWVFMTTRAFRLVAKEGRKIPKNFADDPESEEIAMIVIEHVNYTPRILIAKITVDNGISLVGEFSEGGRASSSRFQFFDRKSN